MLVLLAGCGDIGGLMQDSPPTPTPFPTLGSGPVVVPTRAANATRTATEPATPEATEPATPEATEPATPEATEPPVQSATLAAQSVLDQVRARGVLRCGVNADLPGFGFYDGVRDTWNGFDVDFCRVVAAAVLGDTDAIEFVPLTAGERWEAIRNDQVDVLFRNSTWTADRDTAEGVDFGPTTFHDGQGFMVRQASDIDAVASLADRTICVTASTTTEANLRDEMPARGIPVEIETFESTEETYRAYDSGMCDAVTSDRSQLIALRETLDSPDDHRVLGELISREPLGPAFVENDSTWRDVISWSIFAAIYAEELRVNQENVRVLAETTTDPRIRRLVGLEGTIGEDLGLDRAFALRIIEQVGNYGDIYNRSLGPDTRFDLDRGPNKVWNLGEGGVLSSPPFR